MSTEIGNASELWVNDLLSSMMGVVNGDISTSGSTLTLTLSDIGIKITLAYTSTTSCSVTYYAISGSISPVDIRRCTMYGGGSTETYTLDGGTLTTSGTVVDDTVYTVSNDTSAHFIRVNGTIYIITIWISGNGARASLIYKKVI
mgnify:FL=1